MRLLLCVFIFVVATSCQKKSNSNDAPPPPPPGQGENPPQSNKPDGSYTESFFGSIRETFRNSLDNFERVQIDQATRRIEYLFVRDVADELENTEQATICEYRVRGNVKRVDRSDVTQINHTRIVTLTANIEVDEIEILRGQDEAFERCQAYGKQQREKIRQAPYPMNGLVIKYEFYTPADSYRMDIGNGLQLAGSAFSFQHLTTNNVELTKNDWDLIFKVQPTEDIFDPNTSFRDYSRIYNLGRRHCTDIQPQTSTRYLDPMRWLSRSDANPNNLDPAELLPVQSGNCYLVISDDQDSRLFAFFYVLQHEPGEYVVINEVEVLDILTRVDE